jgi:hypothetical protein
MLGRQGVPGEGLRQLKRGNRSRAGRIAARVAGLATIAVVAMSGFAAANHSWNGYHWPRTQNPFTLKLGDDVGTSWDAHLSAVSADWSRDQADSSWTDATPPPPGDYVGPNPLNTRVVAGSTTGRKCRSTASAIQVCDASYGNNGWLGLATVWVSGSHIAKATVKVNDTYFSTTKYNTPSWRQSVMCQEVGHTFGLDHQDESGADLDTCMDYSTTPNIHPDQHDYNELARIYQHLDSLNGGSVEASASSNGRGSLHRLRDDLYVERLGGGEKRFVWVFWKNRGRHHTAPADAG